MRFTNAALVEQTVWDMRIADLPRGENRALIDRLGNGLPPYRKREVEANRVKTNVNFLEFPELCGDARRSYYNAFLKPGNFFNITLDSGPVIKRRAWGRIITREMNRIMKASPQYFELLRSQIAMTVLHGIGPAVWPDADAWCPQATAIEDVMIPSGTRLAMDNLAYFAIYKELTAMELYRATHGFKRDPAWKMEVVEAAIKWADEQVRAQIGYSDLYAPEKIEERWKQDLGFYGTDAVPTINCWDFYFWSDEGQQSGWRRRMIIDTPTAWEVGGRRKIPKKMPLPRKDAIGGDHGQWLYAPSDNRVFQPKLGNIIHFQFGDASAVAPFHYHSVRALGWLLYAVCHLQNRLRCKVNDAIFEALLQYFRSTNEEDKERILKVDLHDLGMIPQGVNFVPAAERWKVDQQLVALGLGQNKERMQKAAAQYREGKDDSTERKEKTATEIMAEVNSANALLGGLLLQAYQYQEFQGQEIARRFARKESKNPDVLAFRNAVLKGGVEEEYIDAARWTVAVERVLGSGNKTLQIAMADKLMAVRGNLSPQAQREVDYQYVLANTDDPDLTNRLVALEDEGPSDTTHDAAVAMGALLMGIPVPPKRDENQIEVIETWLTGLGKRIQMVKQKGVPTMDELAGLGNAAANIQARIQLLAQDKSNQKRAKGYEKALGALTKVIQAFGKLLAKLAQQGGGQGGNGDQMANAEAQAKLRGKMMMDQVKARNAAVAHAQKTQQRDVQFRMKLRQDQEKHQAELGKKALDAHVDVAAADLKAASDIRNAKLKALNEPKSDGSSEK